MSDKDKTEEVQEEVTQGTPTEEPEEYSDPEMQKLKEERDAAVAKVMERKVFLADRYCEPHTKKSRRVKEADLDRVLTDAPIMHEMCLVGRGEYNTAYAIAHPQIENEDPLRFFVTYEGQIYVNPVIINHSHELYHAQEGCMSYPEEPLRGTLRYKTVTVKFRTVGHKADPETGEDLGQYYLSNEVTQKFEGQMAQIMQHECQHFNGSDIYKSSTSANDAIGEGGSNIITL